MSRARVGFVLSLLAATGCRDELSVSEVVLVLESDLAVPSEVDSVDLSSSAGPIAPATGAMFQQTLLPEFPESVGFVTLGNTSSFSFTVRLLIWGMSPQPDIVVAKTVSDVRFVAGQKRMLVLTMPRVCACHETSCPLPGNPDCANLRNPALEPFDPEVAPPSPMATTLF